MGDEGYDYDVFVSHSEAERGWVRDELLPRLGMRARMWLDVADDAEFEMNVARLVYELRQPPTK